MKLFEAQILNSLTDPENYQKLQKYLIPEIFTSSEAKLIFDCIRKLQEKYNRRIEWEEVKTLLWEYVTDSTKRKDYRGYLRAIRKSRIGVDLLYDLVVKSRQKAEIRRIIQEDVLPVLDTPEPVPIEKITERLVSVSKVEEEEEDYYDYSSRKRIHYDQHLAVPTGIPKLDEIMYGGLYPGEVGLISGAPEEGKTLTAVNFAIAPLIEGRGVYFFTLDETGEDIARRFDLRILGEKGREPIKKFPSWVQGLKIIDRSGGCSIHHISDFIYRHGTPGIVIIDGGDLLIPEIKRKEKRFELSEIYANYLRVSRKFSIPIWVTTQSTAKSQGLVKHMTDLSEAKLEKSSVASAILMVSKTDDDNVIRVRITKLRRPPGQRSLFLEVDKALQRIKEEQIYEEVSESIGGRKRNRA